MSERDDLDLLAAEHSLSLLDGDERARAERLAGADASFAARLAWWQERLLPLLDEIAPIEPGPELWSRINERLDDGGREPNVRPIGAKLRFWRVYGGVATAVAAALTLALASTWRTPPLPPAPTPAPAPAAEPVLVATVAAEDGTAAVVVTVEADRRQLLVAPAVGSAPTARDLQLWLLGEDGTPRSLGVIPSTEPARLPLPADLANGMRQAATLAISVEPSGGSPTGLPTGPVIATGQLRPV